MIKIFLKSLFLSLFLISVSNTAIIEKIEIDGNLRVNDETIKMFSGVNIGDDLSSNGLNEALKKLYETNFFKDVQLKIENSILKIFVVENAIIKSVKINGVKNKTLEKALFENISQKKGASFDKFSAS